MSLWRAGSDAEAMQIRFPPTTAYVPRESVGRPCLTTPSTRSTPSRWKPAYAGPRPPCARRAASCRSSPPTWASWRSRFTTCSTASPRSIACSVASRIPSMSKHRTPDPVEDVIKGVDLPPQFLLAVERLVNRVEDLGNGENSGALCFALAFVLERYLREKFSETLRERPMPAKLTLLLSNLNFLMATVALLAAEYEDDHFTRKQ